MIIVVELGLRATPEVVDAPENFHPKKGAKYMVIFHEEDSMVFVLGVIKKLVDAKVLFTGWELGDTDPIKDNGTTQVW